MEVVTTCLVLAGLAVSCASEDHVRRLYGESTEDYLARRQGILDSRVQRLQRIREEEARFDHDVVRQSRVSRSCVTQPIYDNYGNYVRTDRRCW
jgi:hypothetical protein